MMLGNAYYSYFPSLAAKGIEVFSFDQRYSIFEIVLFMKPELIFINVVDGAALVPPRRSEVSLDQLSRS